MSLNTTSYSIYASKKILILMFLSSLNNLAKDLYLFVEIIKLCRTLEININKFHSVSAFHLYLKKVDFTHILCL